MRRKIIQGKIFQILKTVVFPLTLVVILQGCSKNNVTQQQLDSLTFRVSQIESKVTEMNSIVTKINEKAKDEERKVSIEPSDSTAKYEVQMYWLKNNASDRVYTVSDIKVVGRDRKPDQLVVQCTAHVTCTRQVVGGDAFDDNRYRVYVRYKMFGGIWVLDGSPSIETIRN